MQFCWGSWKGEGQLHDATSHSLLSQGLITPYQPPSVFIYYFNSYCSQFLHLSHSLNQELALNNSLITCKVDPPIEVTEPQETGISDSEVKAPASNINTSSVQLFHGEIYQDSSKKQNMRKDMENSLDSFSCDSYVPDQELQKTVASSTLCQSKNIPKNYGKAIIIFIKKNVCFVRRVLSHLNMNFRDFMRSLSQVKRKLKSIKQLKGLWLDEANHFAKAYRIISMEYLRRHSLSYIFNSRIANIHKHIKYRYKMIEGVVDPRNFTIMKEF